MKWLLFSLVLALAGAGLLTFNHYYEQDRLIAEGRKNALIKEAEEVNELIRLITATKNKSELLALQGRVKGVGDKRLEPVLRLAIAVAVFEEAESNFTKAIEVNNALASPPEPPPTPPIPVIGPHGQIIQPPQLPVPPPPPLHPLVVKNLEEAFKMYKEAKELCDRIQQQPDDNNFNFSLNYFKGEVYYRHTQFLSTPETAKELFDQTLVYWKHALRYNARDVDTVINIELLIKNQQQMLSGAVQPGNNRPQMLPANQAGRGRLKGI